MRYRHWACTLYFEPQFSCRDMDDGKYVQIPASSFADVLSKERTSTHAPPEDTVLDELENLVSDEIACVSNDIAEVSNDVEWMEQVLVGRVDAEATHQEEIKELRISNEAKLHDLRHIHKTEKDALCRQHTKQQNALCQTHAEEQARCADSLRQAEMQAARMAQEVDELKLRMKTQAKQYLVALRHGEDALRRVQKLL